MEITSLPKGKYIVAVSGGVDSVVLLDLLARQSNIDLIVAHLDHGIRRQSAKDADFVRRLAKTYNLPFETLRIELGKDASEAEARLVRYKFLQSLKDKYRAQAIITAHHQDDVIETSIINLIRGTGRRGLSSLKNRDDVYRPLLKISKPQLIKYAVDHGLKWREDKTNEDTKYLRNKVRLEIIPKMSTSQRKQWLEILQKADLINAKLDSELNKMLQMGLHKNQPVLNRKWFAMLPHTLAKEVLMAILIRTGISEIDKKTIERLTVQIKTLPQGKTLQLVGIEIKLTKRSARFNKVSNDKEKEV